VDPLQWGEERYKEETDTVESRLASLGIGNNAAETEVVKVSARYTTDGKVRLTLPSGEPVQTARENWVATEEGYEYEVEWWYYVSQRRLNVQRSERCRAVAVWG
jgi:hypothetical protein